MELQMDRHPKGIDATELARCYNRAHRSRAAIKVTHDDRHETIGIIYFDPVTSTVAFVALSPLETRERINILTGRIRGIELLPYDPLQTVVDIRAHDENFRVPLVGFKLSSISSTRPSKK